MGIKERFKEFIAYKRLTQRRFQASIGVSSAYINSITDGIGADVLRKVSIEYPELNTDWLLTGEGEMLNSAPSSGITQHQNGGSNNSQTLTPGQSDVSKFIELLQKKDEQIDRLLTLLERR